jgi:hypothetical protein
MINGPPHYQIRPSPITLLSPDFFSKISPIQIKICKRWSLFSDQTLNRGPILQRDSYCSLNGQQETYLLFVFVLLLLYVFGWLRFIFTNKNHYHVINNI